MIARNPSSGKMADKVFKYEDQMAALRWQMNQPKAKTVEFKERYQMESLIRCFMEADLRLSQQTCPVALPSNIQPRSWGIATMVMPDEAPKRTKTPTTFFVTQSG